MKFDIDPHELERQRYEEIKKAGRYLELNILIDANEEKYDSKNGNMPVVTTCLHGCTGKEISALYMLLGMMREQLEEDYPLECVMADMRLRTKDYGTISTQIPHDEED